MAQPGRAARAPGPPAQRFCRPAPTALHRAWAVNCRALARGWNVRSSAITVPEFAGAVMRAGACYRSRFGGRCRGSGGALEFFWPDALYYMPHQAIESIANNGAACRNKPLVARGSSGWAPPNAREDGPGPTHGPPAPAPEGPLGARLGSRACRNHHRRPDGCCALVRASCMAGTLALPTHHAPRFVALDQPTPSCRACPCWCRFSRRSRAGGQARCRAQRCVRVHCRRTGLSPTMKAARGSMACRESRSPTCHRCSSATGAGRPRGEWRCGRHWSELQQRATRGCPSCRLRQS